MFVSYVCKMSFINQIANRITNFIHLLIFSGIGHNSLKKKIMFMYKYVFLEYIQVYQKDCITSAQRYIRPQDTQDLPASGFSAAAVDLMYCRSETQFIKKSQCIRPTVGRFHSFLKLVALFCRSDAQYLQVGYTTLVDRMHRFCRSDVQLQVRCITFVGRVHN